MTLNREKKLNSLNDEMVASLKAIYTGALPPNSLVWLEGAEGGKRARVTALGALQLDRDVRALRAAVAAGLKRPGDDRPDAALNAAVREGLGVAMHAATLLGLEDKREASDVVSKFVMPEDLPPILALRWGDDA